MHQTKVIKESFFFTRQAKLKIGKEKISTSTIKNAIATGPNNIRNIRDEARSGASLKNAKDVTTRITTATAEVDTT